MPLVLARGNGKGAWQNELPVEKDLRVRGEISDLKKIRIAGRNAVLVARNDQAVLVLAY